MYSILGWVGCSCVTVLGILLISNIFFVPLLNNVLYVRNVGIQYLIDKYIELHELYMYSTAQMQRRTHLTCYMLLVACSNSTFITSSRQACHSKVTLHLVYNKTKVVFHLKLHICYKAFHHCEYLPLQVYLCSLKSEHALCSITPSIMFPLLRSLDLLNQHHVPSNKSLKIKDIIFFLKEL